MSDDAAARTAREIVQAWRWAESPPVNADFAAWWSRNRGDLEDRIAAALVEARANAFREAAQVAKSYPLRTWPVLPELERELSVAKFVRDEIAAAISRIAWPEKEEELNGR